MSKLNKMNTRKHATQKIVYTNHVFTYYFVLFCITFKVVHPLCLLLKSHI